MATNLAPVYLDDARVQLQGDPRPNVSKIVAAGGKAVDEDVQVVRLREQGDGSGSPLRLEDVIDRSQGGEPVYLRVLPTQGSTRLADDESSGVARPQRPTAAGQAFGAGRPGMAGQGAQTSPGRVAPDKQAKSDSDPDERNGASNQTYGSGDMQPGGRTGLAGSRGNAPRPSRPGRGSPDSTQEFQSGGRQGEGLEASYTDTSVGAGPLRDQSTDHAGRQQGQGGHEEREWTGPDGRRSKGSDPAKGKPDAKGRGPAASTSREGDGLTSQDSD